MNFADREHIALKSNGRLAFAKIRLAAVQAEPAFIDLDRSTEIACNLIDQAAAHGARSSVSQRLSCPSFRTGTKRCQTIR
jgi:hypothetical protein